MIVYIYVNYFIIFCIFFTLFLDKKENKEGIINIITIPLHKEDHLYHHNNLAISAFFLNQEPSYYFSTHQSFLSIFSKFIAHQLAAFVYQLPTATPRVFLTLFPDRSCSIHEFVYQYILNIYSIISKLLLSLIPYFLLLLLA